MHVFEACFLDRPSIQPVLIKCRLHFIMCLQHVFEIEQETGVVWENYKHLFYFIVENILERPCYQPVLSYI